MAYTKQVIGLVAVLALALILVSNVSAFGDITSVELDGVEATDDYAVFAGQTIPVRVTFTATDNASDARVKVWIAGEREFAVATERFDVLEGRTYTKLVLIRVPFDIDPSESLELEVVVENRNDGIADGQTIELSAQRDNYVVEVLDVELDSKVVAGNALPVDIVLKNRGRHFAEDTFVRVKIAALGIENRAYFGDLSPVDQDNPDKEDAVERRMFLNIPRSVVAGVYTVEVEAYNADSASTVTRKVAVTGAGDDSTVVSSARSKSFKVGETAEYSITLVNSGNKVQVYEFVPESSSELSVSVDEPIVAIPAGTSKTLKVSAEAKEAGKQTFAVNVYSNGELVAKESFAADVEGTQVFSGNMTVLLTVVLAVIFVVLLVVLIVLLTRKPSKNEEFGESYY